ncbi:permease [Tuwongella immobilis]|uniref:Permease n=1 Tax=Tuwongella immobilis TaxID=692036 RepID=A0A6C2YNC4_9BACT|nr:permease [Tuwongella immobilis]VIP03120.1 Permease OS=Desulfatibacillum alkenivorans (strain AK-01) GN=Dalk_1552 PE=4 SV=1: DUF318 [Tuwongella immobilis]VTS03448.1 Permease OS=Desulfatibacillum alkenivorans (strain AK-01) GN=Dalk_1552 PE=4 SV=1: DUF318 [Tuwongella immobilis]
MEEQVKDFVITFSSILWEAFPFIVLGALVAGILEEMVPQQAIAKIVPKSRLLAVMLGGGLGLIFPMCECGIVPIMRRLLRKGLPLGTCIAYMLAGPIINLVVIASTAVAFYPHGIGLEMVVLRVGIGFLIACTTAAVVEFVLVPKHGDSLLTEVARPPKPSSNPLSLTVVEDTNEVHPAENRAGESRPFFQRLGNISETALHDFVDIMVFVILGSILAAMAKLFLTADQVSNLSMTYPALAILAMMGLAILLCLCSEADAFVAASFTTLHPSAKLAFLVLGPMFDLKLLLMYTRVFKRRLILTIVSCVIIQVFVYMMLVHVAWNALGLPTSSIGIEVPVATENQ